MARNVTRQAIRNLARLYADQRPGGASDDFVVNTVSSTTPGVDSLIDLAGAEFYDLVIRAGGAERFTTSATHSVVASTSSYALPATHYRTHGIVLEWAANRHENLPTYESVLARSRFVNFGSWVEGGVKAYRLQGANVVILPTPTSAVTARHYFTPNWVDFTHDTTDTKDFVNGWEKLVALHVAIELRAIEERPFADLERLRDAQIVRLEAAAGDRDDHPPEIQDIGTRRGFPMVETS